MPVLARYEGRARRGRPTSIRSGTTAAPVRVLPRDHFVPVFPRASLAGIADHQFSDVRLQQIVQPGGPRALFEGHVQTAVQPAYELQNRFRLGSRMASIIRFPAVSKTAMEIVA